jgi:hypothetical protein
MWTRKEPRRLVCEQQRFRDRMSGVRGRTRQLQRFPSIFSPRILTNLADKLGACGRYGRAGIEGPAAGEAVQERPAVGLAQRPTAWLGWSDSNCGIRWDRSPPVLRGNFSRFGRKGRSRDGSRSSCGVTNVQLRQGFRLVLRARGLTQNDSGAVQHAWLVGFELW